MLFNLVHVYNMCQCSCRHLLRWLERTCDDTGFALSRREGEPLDVDDESIYQIGQPGDAYYRLVAATYPFGETLQRLYSSDEAMALWGTLERCRCCERHRRGRPGRPAAFLGDVLELHHHGATHHGG